MNEELINSIISGAAYEMALPRKVIIDKIKQYSKPLVEHLVKILVYKKTLGEEVFLDWRDNEICSYFAYIASLTTKSSSGKLKEQDYFNAFIEEQGTAPADYLSTISLFQIRNRSSKQYPDFRVEREMGQLLMRCYFELVKAVCPLIANSTSDFVDGSVFRPTVAKVIEKYL